MKITKHVHIKHNRGYWLIAYSLFLTRSSTQTITKQKHNKHNRTEHKDNKHKHARQKHNKT